MPELALLKAETAEEHANPTAFLRSKDRHKVMLGSHLQLQVCT